MKRKSYFFKLLAFSLLLAMIPVIVQGFFSYHKASTMIQDKVLESNRLFLQQSQSHTEQTLKSIESTMLNYVNTTEVLNAMNSSVEPNLFPLFTKLNRNISSMNFYEYGIKRVYLINLKNNWILDGEGVYHLNETDDEPKYADLLNIMNAPSSWMLNQGYIPSTNLSRNQRDDESLVLVQKIPQYSSQPTGLAIVVFPGKALNKMIANSQQLGHFMITDNHDRVIAHSDVSRVGQSLAADPVIEKIKALPIQNGFSTLNVEGQDVGFTFIRSSYNNWTYSSIAPITDITKDSRAIGWLALIIGSIMLVFILILALLGSRKMYRPIAQIYAFAAESFPHGQGDELELIRKQFLNMKNSQFAMKDQLNIQLVQLKDFFLQKLFRGELGYEEAQEKCETFQIAQNWQLLSVFTTQIDSLDHTRFQEKDRDLLMFAINNIVKELVSRKTRFQSVVIDKSQAAIIEHDHLNEDDVKREMYTICEHVQQSVKQYLNVQVSIGISKPYRQLVLTSRAYEEALDALRYRIKYGEESILYLEDVQPEEEDNKLPVFPKHIETELINALNAGDKETVEQKFVQFLDWLLLQQVSYREQQVYLARVLIDVLRVVQDMRINAKVLLENENSIFAQLFNLRTSAELKKWFLEEVIEQILELLKNRREIKYVKVAEELVNIVREEYDTDLSLEICADRLNVHPSYLKRVLRKELDTNFSDYLSRFRLQKAREYLLQTDLKIADIAGRLRYNNPQNFIRYFRKMEGVTPGEYRKKKGPAIIDGWIG